MPLQKRTDNLDWNDLRYVLALARHGSLSATARLLKVNHATVARRIAAVEDNLGMTLFERQARGYVPTSAAASVLQAAEQIEAPLLRLARLGDAYRASAGEQIAGTVRITCTEGVASHTVAPQLAGLRQRWPELQIELVVEHRSLSLARREADIAIRWARPKTGELYASKLGAVPYRLYRNPAALDRNVVAAFDGSLAEIPESLWLKKSGLTQAIRSNSMIPLVAAARAGACAVLLPEYIGRGYAELMPDPGRPPVTRELWLVLHRDLRNTPRIRAVADYLAASVKTVLRQPL